MFGLKRPQRERCENNSDLKGENLNYSRKVNGQSGLRLEVLGTMEHIFEPEIKQVLAFSKENT